ncbi:MAG: hypothetical protein KatS3mg108_0441 [Isosphaeraceae bacterium]|jgi:thiamine biosynthesis lipoprotein ApbE|nr:MAG: hypothetical protein KatS3mg108_0441 [Isosphaeraceae bacterium]
MIGLWMLGLVVATTDPTQPLDEYTFHHEHVLGTSMELRVRAESAKAAQRAEGRVLAEIDRLAAILSNHNPAAEFRRWQAEPTRPITVSAELLEVLHAAEAWRERSDGAFDVRVEALSRLWQAAAAAGRLPTPAQRAEACSLLAGAAYRLDREAGTAERLTAAPMTLDAIAKGFLVEQAARAGLGEGVSGLLLNIGGDLHALGDTPWIVGLAPARNDSESAPPVAWLALRDGSVANSGGSQRYYVIENKRYSHIIDPRTGSPADRVAAATVVAPRGADADALATILNVLDPEDGLRLMSQFPEAACRITTAEGRILTSPNWASFLPHELVTTPVAAVPLDAQDDPSWPDGFELVVQFTIARPEAAPGRYRRPYVVIWVEDQRGELVRQLLVWVSQGGAGPDQWLPDLTRWYGSQDLKGRTQRRNYVYTIGRPTRPPGQYTVVWDGRDDQGRLLPQGRYTLCIEAAREHGTHQLMRQRLEIGTTPFTEQIPGHVEIESATIRYRRKTDAP